MGVCVLTNIVLPMAPSQWDLIDPNRHITPSCNFALEHNLLLLMQYFNHKTSHNKKSQTTPTTNNNYPSTIDMYTPLVTPHLILKPNNVTGVGILLPPHPLSSEYHHVHT